MKKLICTSIYDRTDDLLRFVISLRTLGNYDGEILVLNYSGKTDLTERISKEFNVEFIDLKLLISLISNINPKEPENPISIECNRFFDLLEILYNSKKYQDYLIAHFDCDVWFQCDVNELFYLIKNTKNCLFGAAHVLNLSELVLSTVEGDHNKFKLIYDDNINFMSQQNKNFEKQKLSAGLVAGSYSKLLFKLSEFAQLIKFLKNISRDMDEFVFNLLFRRKEDSLDGKLYAYVPKPLWTDTKKTIGFEFILKENNVWYAVSGDEKQKIVGLHFYIGLQLKGVADMDFKNLYHDIYAENLKRLKL